MLDDLKIVHLSDTPLVGAPGKISQALTNSGVDSIAYCLKDYPNKKNGLHGFFVDTSIVLDDGCDHAYNSLLRNLSNAHIVHVHNSLDGNFFKKILPYCYNSKFIYQVHSPLREGPLFYERGNSFPVEMDRKLVVSQYQPRHYPGYDLVPNITLFPPGFYKRKPGDPLRVMYSPSHSRGGRWNNKGGEGVDVTLRALEKSGLVNPVRLSQPLAPKILFEVRKSCDVSIDEIVTGAFHQISLEALAAGNIAINRADYFSKQMLKLVAKSDNPPPFVYATENSLLGVLTELAEDVDKTNSLKAASFSYYSNHLTSEKLINRYIDIYEETLKC